MTFLPIVERELRVAARRHGTYRSRWLMAVGALLVGGAVMVRYDFLSPGGFVSSKDTGAHIFWWLAGLSLLYCLAAGRFSTADSLSIEKREGTLGLLFLTDLRGYDVVLGKMAATSVEAFYGLLAVFPALAVPLLMGGVTNGQFWRVVLVLVNTFMFSLAIGIYASAVSRSYERAMALNFYLLTLFVIAPLAGLVISFIFGSSIFPELFFSCPVYSLMVGSDANYGSGNWRFWASVATVHVLTWILVWRAGRITPSSWREESPVRGGEKIPRDFRRDRSYGGLRARAAFRKEYLGINPIHWLTSRRLNKPGQVWTFVAFVDFWWFVGWWSCGREWIGQATSLVTAIVLNLALKLWVTMEAGDWLGRDKTTGALELILPTPLTAREMIHGQLLSLRRQFLGPLLFVIAVELFFMTTSDRYSWGDVVERCTIWITGILMLLADLAALTAAAMYNALSAKNPARASVKTAACILVLPWAALWAVFLGRGLLSAAMPVFYEFKPFWPPVWVFFLTLWVGFGLSANVFFGWRAWRRLQAGFRDLAAGESGAKAARQTTEAAG